MTDQNDNQPENDDGADINEPWPGYAFAKASDAACVKCFRLDFDAAVQEYRALEAEFLARIGDRQNDALEIRRRVAERILDAAHGKKAPFETCTNAWNDLLQLGFSNFERKCTMTWFFADCCRKHRQTEIGLAVLEPLIAELERLRAEAAATNESVDYYDHELEPHRKLRAKLEAQRG
jgi:hypothetical protein